LRAVSTDTGFGVGLVLAYELSRHPAGTQVRLMQTSQMPMIPASLWPREAEEHLLDLERRFGRA
jgi:hypothetical protein